MAQWQNIEVPPIVRSEGYYRYSDRVPLVYGAKYHGHSFKNPRAWDSPDRPKLGKNPFLPYDKPQALRYGSKDGVRAQFKPQFATQRGFDNYKLTNPKSNFVFKMEDIDNDEVDDALVMTPEGKYVAVNGMTERASNWNKFGTYYRDRVNIIHNFEVGEGFRDEAGNSKVSGIAKAWRDVYLKEVYDTILTTNGVDEAGAALVKEIRKAVPLSRVAKFFIHELMTQEAIKAIRQGGVNYDEYDSEATAVKAMMATKKFKAYIYNLAMGIRKSDQYRNYIANIIRVVVLNVSKGVWDIAGSPAWRRINIPIEDVGWSAPISRVPFNASTNRPTTRTTTAKRPTKSLSRSEGPISKFLRSIRRRISK
jgi:hypothetical protein